MAQGILSGIALGAVFSVGVAGAISVLVPMQPGPGPEVGDAGSMAPVAPATPPAAAVVTSEATATTTQPAVTLRAPAGEDLPKEPAPAALAPQVDSDVDETVQTAALQSEPVTPPVDQATPLAPRPIPLAVIGAQAEDTVPDVPARAPQPETGEADSLTAPDPLALDLSTQVQPDEPVLPNPQALAPMIPDDTPDSDVLQSPAAPPKPVKDAEWGGEAITIVVPTPLTDEQKKAAALAAAEAAAEKEAAAQAAAAARAAAPKPRIAAVPGTRVATLGADSRLTVGRPANSLINRSEGAAAAAVQTVTEASGPTSGELAPIRRHAQPFENPENKPLMSVLLVDAGANLDAAEIGLPALSRFPYPVSFAVDVSLPDAFERMERYRAEGFEVLAMLDLPAGARASDAEVSVAAALNGLPAVIGVLEGLGEGLQGSREVADQVTGILRASGHGLVTQSRGLNSMPKLAVKDGVPAAPVFRDFDSKGQSARVIRRFLDQAAFKAGQEGGVIMMGRLRPETIEALLVWGLADRAGSVALAPVSAVLLAQR
ncbi:divergent polysaccharide deacetylase family protein [Sulfitobacter sp. HNIBRBA2951]|uniref:divergent polysaccharide deacetylase family protein n=1 Tax=Sulfitobacter aquimarinus TaxID=3158557 RepID=UPI0032DF6C65